MLRYFGRNDLLKKFDALSFFGFLKISNDLVLYSGSLKIKRNIALVCTVAPSSIMTCVNLSHHRRWEKTKGHNKITSIFTFSIIHHVRNRLKCWTKHTMCTRYTWTPIYKCKWVKPNNPLWGCGVLNPPYHLSSWFNSYKI